MNKLTLRDIDVRGKRVLMRVDFNVPVDENLNITDDTRIRAALPSIKYVIDNGGKLILMSHMGRPKGKVVESLRLDPAANRLSELLAKPVIKLADCVGKDVENVVFNMKEGDVVLLENLRFYREEEANDPVFAKQLARLGEIYVNDAFGTAHRAHASTEGVTHYIDLCVAGFLMEKELQYLGKALENPERPFIAILGGAKISGKIDVIKNLMNKVDALLIGGGMAYTFFKAMGYEIGNSILEEDKIDLAKEILEEVRKRDIKFLLPVDTVIADEFSKDANTEIVSVTEIPVGWEGVDIGPETIQIFSEEIKRAKTIVWNGPMGVFEIDKFAVGTNQIAKAIAESGAVSIIGGGDSVAAVKRAGYADKITHISTGGGASLEFLEGKELPGVKALTDKS